MISAHDRGLLYGDGVFETVRFGSGKLQLWSLHLDRLISSCSKLDIPLDPDSIDQVVSASLEHAPAPDGVLKIIVTRGEGGRGYVPPKLAKPTVVVQWHPLPPDIEKSFQQGIDCIYCDHPLSLNPVTAGIKHLNRLDQVLASLQLSRATDSFPHLKEGLMSDGRGNLIEGTRSNIFAVLEDKLCTPDLSLAGVRGVMRDFIISRMNSDGIDVDVRQIRKQELSLASELFVCNSVIGVWPVARILNLAPELATANVEIEFPSRQMADIVSKVIQEAFCL